MVVVLQGVQGVDTHHGRPRDREGLHPASGGGALPAAVRLRGMSDIPGTGVFSFVPSGAYFCSLYFLQVHSSARFLLARRIYWPTSCFMGMLRCFLIIRPARCEEEKIMTNPL